MTTNETISLLRTRLDLTSRQADAIFPAMAALVAEALERDGVCLLGALGAVQLGVWPERVQQDGRVQPETACPVYQASQTLKRRVQGIPLVAARMACRRRGWDPDRQAG